jgi:hypothetical protein
VAGFLTTERKLSKQGRAIAVLGAVALLFGCALDVAVAQAGTYQVAICHDPSSGLSAPTDGISFLTAGSGAEAGVYQGCGTAGYLYATLDGTVAHGPSDLAEWTFTAPAGTTIDGVQVFRAFTVGPSAAYESPVDWLESTAADGTVSVLADCTAAYGCSASGTGPLSEFAAANELDFGALDGAVAIDGEAQCGGGDPCAPGGGAVCPELGGDPCIASNHIYALVVTLEDDIAPIATDVSGPLISGGVISGAAAVSFDATDVGSGLYSAALSVDGSQVVSTSLGSNGSHCTPIDLPGSGESAPSVARFAWTVPCPLAASGTLMLDTASLLDGVHQLELTLTDAAGNVAPIWTGTIDTDNAPQGGAPTIDGYAQQGQTLVANAGAWTPQPSSFGYQWELCDAEGDACTAIPGANGSAYTVGAADAYGQLKVLVTASDGDGSSDASSSASGVVLDADGNASPPAVTSTTGRGAVHAGGAAAGGAASAGGVQAGPTGGSSAGGAACAEARLRALVNGSSRVAIPFGRSVTLRGTLHCGGATGEHAVLRVELAPTAGAVRPHYAQVTTGATGAFAYRVGPGPSRRVSVSYVAAGGARPVSASAQIVVTPEISLSITPTSTFNGDTITFRGRVSGGHEPRGGLPLEMEYLEGRQWMIYQIIHADPADGHFVYRYTFRRTTESITYSFRFAIPASGVAGYPFASAASPARSVHVDP